MNQVQIFLVMFLLIFPIKESILESTSEELFDIFRDYEKLDSAFGEIIHEINIPLPFNNTGFFLSQTAIKHNNRFREKLLSVSRKINNLKSRIGVQDCIDETFNDILINVKYYIAYIYNLYDKSVNLQANDSAQSFYFFTDFIYSISMIKSTLPDILDKIEKKLLITSQKVPMYEQKISESLKVYHQNQSLNGNRCNNFQPIQKSIYCTYFGIIVAEMEGFIVFAHQMIIEILMDARKSIDDLKNLRITSLKRLNNYTIATQELMKQLSTVVRRCDSKTWIRGESFIELEKHIRDEYVDEISFNEGCRGQCNTVNYTRFRPDGNGTITRCFNIQTPVDICHSPAGSPRSVEWILDGQGNQYGRLSEDCDHDGNFKYYGRDDKTECASCICEVVRSFEISIGRQVSNILENKIVVGVKFVEDRGKIALRIRESELGSLGFVKYNPDWREVQDSDSVVTMKVEKAAQMCIGDVMVPSGYVVTGVQLKVTSDGQGLMLSVQGAKYDFFSGKLDATTAEWFDSDCNTTNRSDVGPVYDDDDPCLAENNQPVSVSTTTRVTFSSTSFQSDAGQMTIPLFDAQPVITHPEFPLNGIGVFYKKAKGFGGFLALQIFSDRLEKYLGCVH